MVTVGAWTVDYFFGEGVRVGPVVGGRARVAGDGLKGELTENLSLVEFSTAEEPGVRPAVGMISGVTGSTLLAFGVYFTGGKAPAIITPLGGGF